jgi:hypothetical protein
VIAGVLSYVVYWAFFDMGRLPEVELIGGATYNRLIPNYYKLVVVLMATLKSGETATQSGTYTKVGYGRGKVKDG